MLDLLWMLEERLIRYGSLPSDFTLLVARNRQPEFAKIQ